MKCRYDTIANNRQGVGVTESPFVNYIFIAIIIANNTTLILESIFVSCIIIHEQVFLPITFCKYIDNIHPKWKLILHQTFRYLDIYAYLFINGHVIYRLNTRTFDRLATGLQNRIAKRRRLRFMCRRVHPLQVLLIQIDTNGFSSIWPCCEIKCCYKFTNVIPNIFLWYHKHFRLL